MAIVAGIDFGTLSVRVTLLDSERGQFSPAKMPKPSLKVAAAAWIYAGDAHHTGFSQALTTEHLEDFAEFNGGALRYVSTFFNGKGVDL